MEATGSQLAQSAQGGAVLQTRPGDWAVNHAPAVNTKATITKTAGASGVRHVCTSVSFRIAGDAAAAPAAFIATVNLRDGAAGAGTILLSWTLAMAAAVASVDAVNLPGLNIVGTAATAMTLEFTAAGGANSFESVAMTGYSVPA